MTKSHFIATYHHWWGRSEKTKLAHPIRPFEAFSYYRVHPEKALHENLGQSHRIFQLLVLYYSHPCNNMPLMLPDRTSPETIKFNCAKKWKTNITKCTLTCNMFSKVSSTAVKSDILITQLVLLLHSFQGCLQKHRQLIWYCENRKGK